jgi:cysteine rich repeat protein
MTIPKAIVLAALFSAMTSSASVAQSPVVAQWKTYVLESCGKEMKRFCNKVVAGDGRILSCLYARDKSLSGNCRTAVASARERLARSYAAAVEAQRICEPDARRLCAGMVPGGGNLTDCLALARTRVSRACNAVLDEALLRP